MFVDVKLWEHFVGTLSWDEQRKVGVFEYDEKFLRSGLDISPIVMPSTLKSKNMPYQFLQNRTDCFKGLPGLIADSLPDKYGTEIINEWFATRGMPHERITPLDRLCYIGKRGMGALEFEPSKYIQGLDVSTQIHIDVLSELADSIFKNRSDFREKLMQQDKAILDILKIGTSAGGAKPKAVIAYNEKTNEVRSGQIKAPDGFTYWLLKFDGSGFMEHGYLSDGVKGIGNIEYAYYRMAVDAGIKMTECRLLSEGDRHHFMTKRYDRKDNGDKLHVQTLAGLAHYDRDMLHSYETAFGCLRKMKLSAAEQEEFFRRMVFNVVSKNHDDHTKNHGFLMDREGNWSLTPAYDLCYSYKPGGQFTDVHQMSINGKRDNFTFEDMMAAAQNMGISKAGEIIEKTIEVVSRWNEYAKDCGVKDDHRKLINDNLCLLSCPPKIHQPEQDDIQISITKRNKRCIMKPTVNGKEFVAEFITKADCSAYESGQLTARQLLDKYYPVWNKSMSMKR